MHGLAIVDSSRVEADSKCSLPFQKWDAVLETLRVQSPAGLKAVNYDHKRMEKAMYGQYLFSQPAGSTILDIGIGSGVAAFRFACWAAGKHHVICVSKDANKAHSFQQIADQHGLSNICFFSTIADVERALKPLGNKINFLRFEKDSFDVTLFKNFLDGYQVRVAYGEYDEKDILSLDLYRLCSSKTENFYWYNAERRDIVAGDHWEGPEVSILVKACANPAYLAQCLHSLARQTLENKEIILVDNGLPAEALAEITKFQDKHPGLLRLITKPDASSAQMRAIALADAKGSYVTFIDGQDWVEPDMYENLYEFAVLKRAQVVRCKARCIDVASNSVTEEVSPNIRTVENAGRWGMVIDPYDFVNFSGSLGCLLYRTDFLRSLGLDFLQQIKRYDEIYLASASIMASNRGVFLPDFYYNRRAENNSEPSPENLFDYFDVFEYLHKEVQLRGNWPIEIRHKSIEIDAHLANLPKLSGKHKSAYFLKAAQSLFDQRCYVTTTDILFLTRKRGATAATLILAMYIANLCAPSKTETKAAA